jgi:CobQ-like glutamine amidotransferase family enzyme
VADSRLAIALVYPTLLGTYGDGGNALVLAWRLRWRDLPAEIVSVAPGEPVPASADVYVLGGGEDAAQTLAAAALADPPVLARAAAAGRAVLAVCAGYQIVGRSFLDGAGGQHPGLGLLDVRTDRLPGRRAVGELLAEPVDGGPPLTGYENHGGRTVLGPGVRPLARVRVGVGNGDGTEGATAGSVIATYAHGPVLARNPALADRLLRFVVGDLPALSDEEERELRRERLAAVRRDRWRWWRRQSRPPARTVSPRDAAPGRP